MLLRPLPGSRPARTSASPAAALGLVLLTGCGPGAPGAGDAPTPTPISTEMALQTFDSAWSRINSSYYDPEFRGIDWPGIRDELRPSAAAANTREDLRTVLRDMLSRLGESHFAILPEESVDAISVDDDGVVEEDDATEGGPGDLGLEFRWVDGRMTVFRVREGSAMDAGVRAGWVVASIGDRSMDRWESVVSEAEPGRARIAVETETLQGAGSLVEGPSGSIVHLTLEDGDGELRALALERRPVKGDLVQFGALPAMASWLDYRRVPTDSGACIGVIEFNIWMAPLVAPFNRAVDALDDCAGMVIDLRGNLGGVGGMVMSTAGSFFGERAELGTVESRTGELNFVAMPRGVDSEGQLRDAFEGRLAVLVDRMSMSTSEIFAAGLKSTGRARLFGQTTPGYALPAMTIRLPTGDVLYHVVSNLTDPEGVRIEGLGVQPDVEIPLRRDVLLEGRDEVMDAAIAWAAESGQER